MTDAEITIGKEYGRLTVLRPADKPRHYVCRCRCGNERTVRRDNLRTHTVSCGCWKKEQAKRFWKTLGAGV